jgi:imidazolonepropionase-like amidohydrolase
MRTIPTLVLAVALAALAQPALAQTTALVGGRIIDGSGKVIEAGTVVMAGGKITAVGPASTPVPAGATRIDVKGKTLLPGLVNAHGHVADTVGLSTDSQAGVARENLVRQLRTYAMYGVTTVFSLGGDPPASFVLRDEPPPLARASSSPGL